MDIISKDTRTHTAVATTEVLKAVAIAAVKNQLGLADAAVVSADATVDAGGAITVKVVEALADAAPAAPVITIPAGLGGIAAPTA